VYASTLDEKTRARRRPAPACRCHRARGGPQRARSQPERDA